MGLGWVIGHARERTRIVAADILLDAIAGSNEAPLKRALLDVGPRRGRAVLPGRLRAAALRRRCRCASLGEDAAKRLRAAVDAELQRLAAGGLDHALVEASISRAEFVMRERDFGMADGVALAMTSLCGWLYDDDLATAYLRYEDDFAYLRRALDEGYFEDLIREVFLDSAHMAEVEVRPRREATGRPRGSDAWPSSPPASPTTTSQRMAEDEAVLLRRHAGGAGCARGRGHTAAACPSPTSVRRPSSPPTAWPRARPFPASRHHMPTRGLVFAYRYFDLSCA